MSESDQYADRATQTDGAVSQGRDSDLDAQDISEVSVSSMSSCVIHTRPPTPIVVEESDDSILSASSLASIYANTRTLKHPQAVYLRPTAVGAQTLKSTSSRIVSLPETVAKFSAKQEIQGRRVVSMPERSGRVAN